MALLELTRMLMNSCERSSSKSGYYVRDVFMPKNESLTENDSSISHGE